jgi:hypothetical protein
MDKKSGSGIQDKHPQGLKSFLNGWKCRKASYSSRRSVPGKGDESDDDDSNVSAPTNDIYRKRQQKRIK